MPQYELVEVVAIGDEMVVGDTLGYAVKKAGLPKLEGTNLYREDELDEALAYVKSLNEAAELQQFMPRFDDPDVQVLLNDPNFEAVEYEDVEVPDWENSKVVYKTVEEEDIPALFARGEVDQFGRILGTDGGPVIDYTRSNIITKIGRFPKRTDTKSRIDKAREQVARARREQAVNA
jgi:hypothetical protein